MKIAAPSDIDGNPELFASSLGAVTVLVPRGTIAGMPSSRSWDCTSTGRRAFAALALIAGIAGCSSSASTASRPTRTRTEAGWWAYPPLSSVQYFPSTVTDQSAPRGSPCALARDPGHVGFVPRRPAALTRRPHRTTPAACALRPARSGAPARWSRAARRQGRPRSVARRRTRSAHG